LLTYDDLFQRSPNAYMVLDREFRYLEANHAYASLIGMAREALLGRCLFELFPGTRNEDGSSQADILRASFERAFATGERDVLALIPYAIANGTADGPVVSMRYWSATHTPLRDAQGEVYAVLQHTTDVTELHRLREEVRLARAATGLTMEQLQEGVLSRAAAVQQRVQALSAEHRFLTDLFEQAPGFIAVLRGPRHIFTLANDAYERLVDRDGFIGLEVREALPDLAEQGFFELLDRVFASGEPYLGTGVPVMFGADRAVTRFVDFVYQPIRDASGAIEGIFVQGADVTDRHVALAAARESGQRFRTIANLVPQLVWSALPDGRHDYFNQRWYDFTGVGEGATDGEGWARLLHPDDRDGAMARWAHSLRTGEAYEIEYRLRDAAGDYRWLLGRAVPVRDAHGAIQRWMGTCTDIHEHRMMREALERSEDALRAADRQKDQFLATLAHELRNPLSPISMAAELLRRSPDPTTVARAAEIIGRQAEHMRHLVEDLVDVSRVTRGLVTIEPRPLELARIVAAAVEQAAPAAGQRGHRLELEDAAPGLVVDADAVRLTQVVANLLSNATKYTPPGGHIRLSIAREGDEAVLRVRDNGTGMDAALLPRVFELFTQAEVTPARRVGGLGVGLALALSMARMHGGSLHAFSEGLGKGSMFELRLPVSRQDRPGAPIAPGGGVPATV
jgi:PAS domain S-box-containing protein